MFTIKISELGAINYLSDEDQLPVVDTSDTTTKKVTAAQIREFLLTTLAPGSVVVSATSFGIEPAVGTSLTYAREDHTHGTPPDPMPDHLASPDPHNGYLLANGARALTNTFNAGAQRITALANPVSVTDAANKAYVDSKVQGLDWQESVKSRLNDPPASPTAQARYLLDTVPTGDWAGHANEIATWNGVTWGFDVPNDGWAVWIEDADVLRVFNGSEWVTFGSTSDHGVLAGLLDDDHPQYLLIDGTRSMTGALTIEEGSGAITIGSATIVSTAPETLVIDNTSEGALVQVGGTAAVNISGAYTLPTNMGSYGDVLTSDGAGGVTWEAPIDALTGSGAATQVAFWDTATSLSSSANLYWDNTGSGKLGIGTVTPGSVVDIQAGTPSGTAYALNVAGTLNTGAATRGGAEFDFTANGGSGVRFGAEYYLHGTFSAASPTRAFVADNRLPGTGTNLFSNLQQFNAGATASAGNVLGGVTNVGIAGYGVDGSTLSVGVLGYGLTGANTVGPNRIGVVGMADTTSTVTNIVGGYFGLAAFNSANPTFTSAALLADNGSQAAPIFLARDNSTTVFTIADSGYVTSKNTSDSTTAFQVQNAVGTAVFDVDTANARVGIGVSVPVSLIDARRDQNAGTLLNVRNLSNTASSSVAINAGSTTASAALFANSDAYSDWTNIAVNMPPTRVAGLVFPGSPTTNSFNVIGGNFGSGPIDIIPNMNGSQRVFRVDTSGRVIINGTGTSTTTNRFDVKDSTGVSSVFTVGDGAVGVVARNATNSTTAFQVQNAAGSTILNVNTTNGYVGINTTAVGGVDLDVGDGTGTRYIRAYGANPIIYTASSSTTGEAKVSSSNSGSNSLDMIMLGSANATVGGPRVAGEAYLGTNTGVLNIGSLRATNPSIGFFTGTGTVITEVERARVANTEFVVNDPGNAYNFRVESDGNANMLFVDGTNNRVGVGTATPSYPLTVSVSQNTATEARVVNANTGNQAAASFSAENDSGRVVSLAVRSSTHSNVIAGLSEANAVNYLTGGSAAVSRVFFTNYGAGAPFYFVPDSAASAPALSVLVNGNVGVGTVTPTSTFSVGSSSQFQVSSTGDIVAIRGLTYSFPPSQGAANTVLTNNGSGTLSWDAIPPGLTGSGVDNRLAVWSGTDSLDSDAALTWDGATLGVAGALSKTGVGSFSLYTETSSEINVANGKLDVTVLLNRFKQYGYAGLELRTDYLIEAHADIVLAGSGSDPIGADAMSGTTLTDNTQSWGVNALVGNFIEVALSLSNDGPPEPSGVVVSGVIASNTATEITVTSPWENYGSVYTYTIYAADKRVRNVADPEYPHDVATKKYVDEYVAASVTTTAITTVTNTMFVALTDGTILVDAELGVVDVILPDATTCPGQMFVIKKIDTSANKVVVGAYGYNDGDIPDQYIDGSTSYELRNQYEAIKVQSNGTQFWII